MQPRVQKQWMIPEFLRFHDLQREPVAAHTIPQRGSLSGIQSFTDQQFWDFPLVTKPDLWMPLPVSLMHDSTSVLSQT